MSIFGRLPAWAITAAKTLFAGALLAWLISRGVLNFSVVTSSLSRWPVLVAILTLVYGQYALLAWRWRMLLEVQQVRLDYREVFSLTMIGGLFNLITPSSVGGDLTKSYYIHLRAGDRKAEAVATIVLDRFIGLLALLLVAAVTALPSLLTPGSLQVVRLLAALSLAGAGAVVAALLIAMRLGHAGHQLANHHRILRIAGRMVGSMTGYRQEPSVLVKATLGSMISHLGSCGGFYLAAHALGTVAPDWRLLYLVPLGLMTTTLPLAPAGIGVGQVAFAELFRLATGGAYTDGANTFTVFQAVVFLVNLSGLAAYLSYREPAAPAASPTVFRP